MTKDISFSKLQTRDFVGHKKKVHSVAWNCTGTKLASGSVDQTARIWSVDPTRDSYQKEARSDLELKGHADSVDQLCWDPANESQLATASGDRTMRIWDTRAGKCVQTVQTQGENINICWSPTGSYIAVGSRDDVITFIDTRKFKVMGEPTSFNYEVNEIGWSKVGDEFYLTTGLGTIEVMKYPSMEPKQTLHAHTSGCYCISFDPLGKYFAVGSADALVSLWDVQEKICVRTLTRLDWPVRTLSFSHDGRYLASASEDLTIDIADVSTGEAAHAVSVRCAMNFVAWSPTHLLLAYAGDDKDYPGIVRVFGY